MVLYYPLILLGMIGLSSQALTPSRAYGVDRIIRGGNTAITTPTLHQSFLQLNYMIGTTSSFVCGAVYVQQGYAVTAASCLDNIPSTATRIDLHYGSDTLASGDTRQLTVTETFKHPNFGNTTRPEFKAFDVAVLQFTGTVPSTLAPATLCTSSTCGSGNRMRFIGFGLGNNEETPRTSPKRLNGIIDNADAEFEGGELFSADIQTGFNTNRDTKGPCYLDYGGPLYNRDTQETCGVMSWLWVDSESGDCLTYLPVTFTNLCNAGIREFIAGVIAGGVAPGTTTTEAATTAAATTAAATTAAATTAAATTAAATTTAATTAAATTTAAGTNCVAI